jgi:2-keto-4-pentenoate hydratase/2-oxohepta-3-ene-1,7-dioic acid hydratase in catechol pathway
MKLFRWGAPGREQPGVVIEDGSWRDVSRFGEDIDERFFGSDGLDRLRAWVAKSGSACPTIDPTSPSLRIGPPIVRPSKLVCVGLNYRDHAAEANLPIPTEPILFLKATTAISGPYDAVQLPAGSRKLDWEAELAVVIGRRARDVSAASALDHVAGYCMHNDYSERELQLEHGGQWCKGKSHDTFSPLGPWLVTSDEVDPHRLEICLSVNGRQMQRGSTATMIFDVAALVSYISRFMTLLPGDVISTGTPAGVALGRTPAPFLRPGDVVQLAITGLGEACQRVAPLEAPAGEEP